MTRNTVDKESALLVAFFHAAKSGQTEVVDVLLRAGVDIHAQQDLALRAAAEVGQTEMVCFLLDHGADVHAKGGEPLLNADTNGHKATATLIMHRMRKSTAEHRPPAC